MKKVALLTCLAIMLGGTCLPQITMNSSGDVGIGAPVDGNYNLSVSAPFKVYSGNSELKFMPEGYTIKVYPSMTNAFYLGKSDKAFQHVWSYNHDTPSDSVLKENIQDLNNSLYIILNLRGVRYDLKKEIAYDQNIITDPQVIERLEEERKNQIGFISQEVFQILPEVVNKDDSSGLYSIDYSRVIPVLVNAMQEQHALISELKSEVEYLKSEELLKNASLNYGITAVENSELSYISQNLPNPFTESTNIEYFIAIDVKSANIYIYNMSGTQLKSYDLHLNGNGNIKINAGELNPGMYMYTLITDGKVIDTKRMILTD
ncbi:MAG: T9SS type A sorting domain-containing protein [Clostridiaceae bacterium]|nr:T9SS type A sorting domain-containing protein [Clostridiaceae bacterium]